MQQEIEDGIRKSFVGEEEKRFRKRMTGKMKAEIRHGCMLDLEEDNRIALAQHKHKIEADYLTSHGKTLEELRARLREEQKRSDWLQARLKTTEKELKELKDKSGETHASVHTE